MLTRFLQVVEAMVHALSAVFPRPRYVVGWDALLLWSVIEYAAWDKKEELREREVGTRK